MSVNRYATRAGLAYEGGLMHHIRGRGFEVDRLRLAGVEDEGDLVIRRLGKYHIIEAKRTKALDLAGWVKEAREERLNFATHRAIQEDSLAFPSFAVVHYARGKGIGQSYVTTTLDEWLHWL